MADLDEELWKLGILAKTEHNEVAPAQHELAPIFTIDQRRHRPQPAHHGDHEEGRASGTVWSVCCMKSLLTGVNGSGKHNNWSMSTDTGVQPAQPRHDAVSDTAQFLLFLVAVIQGGRRLSGSAPHLGRDAPATTIASARTRRRPPLSRCSSAMSCPQSSMPSKRTKPYCGHARSRHEARRQRPAEVHHATTPTATAPPRLPSPATSSSSACSARRTPSPAATSCSTPPSPSR